MPSEPTVTRLPASLAGVDLRQRDFAFSADGGEAKFSSLGMGVLSDGTPFLTQRGLAALCGVENAHISTISSQWLDKIEKPRIRKIREILAGHGHIFTTAHQEQKIGSQLIFAYKEQFCLAVLEYYAFEAGQHAQPEALANYRLLAGKGLREFIYEALGYKPNQNFDRRWQPFLDRVSNTFNALPPGYYSIFREIADMVVTLGERGIFMDEKMLPDISVGKSWSIYWLKNGYDDRFGLRSEYEHNYPDYFPQSVSNPQHPWCYPDSSLGAFRHWFRTTYIAGGKFKCYLDGQVKLKKIEGALASEALLAYNSANPAIKGL